VDGHSSASHGSLPLTGERTLPGVASENYWFRRHEAAYEWVAPLVTGRVAVDVGCGEGYGVARLARSARQVLGLDYDAAAVAHAGAAYPSVPFVRANLARLPLADATADVVVSLQVIEHVWNQLEFVEQCRRVLRPGARLVVSTPNRLTFSPGSERPVNPFHTHEFTAAELGDLLLAAGLNLESMSGLHAGRRLAEFDDRHGGFVAAQLAAAPEQWPVELVGDVAAVAVEDFAVLSEDIADVDRSLDLIAVAGRPV
jgi:SAM-dependent methyltransferase